MDTSPGVARKSWRIRYEAGELHTLTVDDPETGSDIRVHEPTRVRIECKTRSDFGALSQGLMKQMIGDINKVFSEERDAFAFAFDEAIYTKLRGQSAAFPGRQSRPGMSQMVTAPFLPSADLLTQEYRYYSGRALIERNPRYNDVNIPNWLPPMIGDWGDSLAYIRIVTMPNLQPNPPRRRVVGVFGLPPEDVVDDAIPIPQRE